MAADHRLYLDHNATAPLRPEAREALTQALALTGNASSIHREGRQARALLEAARRQLADLLGRAPAAVHFTASATEANNTLLRGLELGGGRPRLLLSAGEHPSVLAAAPEGERLALRPDGRLDLAALERALAGPRPALVALQAANNETGVCQDLAAAATLCRAAGAWLHVDAVQAAGRLEPTAWSGAADSLALSSHKLGGPQGAGALILLRSEGAEVTLRPLLAGGGQEGRRRAGTEPVALIAGFGAAAEAAARDREAAAPRLQDFRDALESGLRALEPETTIFGEAAPRLPNTTCFAVPGVKAETALIALDLAGVAVSSGAACSSGRVERSHVLTAMGAAPGLAAGALRVSTGWDSDEEAVAGFLDRWAKVLRQLRKRAA